MPTLLAASIEQNKGLWAASSRRAHTLPTSPLVTSNSPTNGHPKSPRQDVQNRARMRDFSGLCNFAFLRRVAARGFRFFVKSDGASEARQARRAHLDPDSARSRQGWAACGRVWATRPFALSARSAGRPQAVHACLSRNVCIPHHSAAAFFVMRAVASLSR